MYGRIDVTPDAPWARDVRLDAVVAAGAQAGWHRCEAPGLILQWDGGRATHAAAADALCIAWGAPALAPAPPQGVAPRVDAKAILARWRKEASGALAGLHGAYGVLIADAAPATGRARRRPLFDGDRVLCAGRRGARRLRPRGRGSVSASRAVAPVALRLPVFPLHSRTPDRLSRHSPARGRHASHRRRWQRADRQSLAAPVPRRAGRRRPRARVAVPCAPARGGDPRGDVRRATRMLPVRRNGQLDRGRDAGERRALRRVRTYSIGFDATGYDEMAYARIAARHFGTEHHEYYVTADDVASEVPALARSFDQPFGNSSVAAHLFLRAHGERRRRHAHARRRRRR